MFLIKSSQTTVNTGLPVFVLNGTVDVIKNDYQNFALFVCIKKTLDIFRMKCLRNNCLFDLNRAIK